MGRHHIIAIIICLLLCASGCRTSKYLEEKDIVLVRKNKVELVDGGNVRHKGTLLAELDGYHKLKPNRKFMGMFRIRLWFYQHHSSPSDTTKWDNFVRQFLAEPPAVLKERLVAGTAEAMESHMKHMGYFNARVEHETEVDSARRMAVNHYRVYANERYTYDSVLFQSADDYIGKLLQDTKEKSFLQSGRSVDVDDYDKEVNRLVRLFRNRGYLDFSKAFISPLDADSAGTRVNATLTVLLSQDSMPHQTYRIGKVYVYPNYDPDIRDLYEEDATLDGVSYLSVGNPSVKYPALSRNVKLRAGDLYSLENEETTKKRLASLGLYKFISIKAEKRDSVQGIVDFRIYLPSKKKQELGVDIELNTANNTTLNSISIGTALSFNYRNKNVFGGAEVLDADLQGGLEIALRNALGNSRFNSVDVSAGTSLSIPKFVDYIGFYTLLNKMRILSNRGYRKLKGTANTSIRLGYNYLRLVNFYDYNSLEASLGHTIRPNARWTVRFNPTGLTYFNPSIRPAFQAILDENNFLAESFGRQLFTGLFARDAQSAYVSKLKNVSAVTRFVGEISGLEMLILNSAFSPNREWRLFDTIEYSSYLKLDAEQTVLKTFSPRHAVAFRLNAGVAFPYGRFSDSVPYVKQFFVGGPNSIRAWNVRELGPGGYHDTEVNGRRSPFYQTGDIKMELNLEYRFDMFWLVDGAFFLDMGNVWTIRNDTDRPNARISKDFWRQFAVGTGLGFRLDFSFFILRLDLGYPLKNNYPDANGRYWRREPFRLREFNFNLAIGYPFG